jgi:hypothetical protein
MTPEDTLAFLAEHRISLFCGHPAYVEAVRESGDPECPRVTKRRCYWHEHADAAACIAAVVKKVLAA